MLKDLHYPFNYKWFISDTVAVLGWVYDEHGKVLEASSFAALFDPISDTDSFRILLRSLNGHFAVVIDKSDFRAAAVDHIRSIPILYKCSDVSFQLVNNFRSNTESWKQSAMNELKNCWCVLGNDTLLDNVEQLLPGQFIYENGDKANVEFYNFHYRKQKVDAVDEEKAYKVLENTFKRLADHIQDRQVIVPLSGGYDSRLIVAMLHKLGHENMMAYTYGNKNSHEVKIAQKVAEQLNVEWHFIEYNDELFKSFFTDDWKKYSSKNHFLNSLPHEQDYFALHELIAKGVIKKDFLAIPGYCGDLLGGSITAYPVQNFDKQSLGLFLKKRHFQEQDLNAHLSDCGLHNFKIEDEASFYNAYQHWFVCNKVSKFIINSVRVYEYFGGEWLMPLWDNELVDYWYSVPYEFRKKQQFYNQVLFDRIFKPLEIDFKKPGFDDNYPSTIKETIKNWIPDSITKGVVKLKKHTVPKDPNNLQVLNGMIRTELKRDEKFDANEINNTHAIYFLQNLNK